MYRLNSPELLRYHAYRAGCYCSHISLRCEQLLELKADPGLPGIVSIMLCLSILRAQIMKVDEHMFCCEETAA